ncbi:hypothetical protein KY284_008048 [Solanum tuberosum]|nr:hypothetical protein KY284_008048 [Solanum tuberosum]
MATSSVFQMQILCGEKLVKKCLATNQINYHKMSPIKLELQHVLLTKQNNSSLLFMHLKKAQHPTLVRRNKMSFLRSFISRAQHPTHVRNNKISVLKLLQRKVVR